MKIFIRTLSLLALGLGMQACASITTGTEQAVAVETTPVQQAACTLKNEKGEWTVRSTPGSATVTKAYGAMTVQCKTEAGHSGSTTVESTTAGATFGNIIAGGIIGAAVDMGSGAAYKYPSQIIVPMQGSQPAVPSASSQVENPRVQAPATVLCRVGKIEEHRDEDWCRQAGGKIIRTNSPQPTSTPAPTQASASFSESTGTCYLPDGNTARMSKSACSAQKGFIGA